MVIPLNRFGPLLMLGLLVTLTAPAAASEGDGGRAAFLKASKYFEAEEFEAALPYFEQAYEQSGRRPSTVFGFAQCLRALKHYDRAIELFQEYLASEPDNATEVRETLGLLKEIAARHRREREEEARQARERAEAEARAEKEAEMQAKVRAEKEAEMQAKARANLLRKTDEGAAQPSAALPAPSSLTSPPPPRVEDSPKNTSILSSPWFWIVTGAALVGGAVVVGVAATSGQSDGYGGNTDIVLFPLRGQR